MTSTSTERTTFAADLASLAGSVAGPVLGPDDDGYVAETAAYNLTVPQRPLVAVGATGSADVRAAVAFAARHDLPVAVLATGHGPMHGTEAAVLINTRRMSRVTIDVAAGTARIGAGARWEQVLPETTQYGLAPMMGSAPTVGAVAFTLGGGLSPYLGRPYGWAADHVTAVELVTADARLVRVTADQDPDLFWAVRGGKGNFGVVTALEISLLPVPRLYGGGLFFAGADIATVLHAYGRWARDVPEDMSSSVAVLRLPDAPFVPEPLRGRAVLHVRIAYLGAAADGARLLAPLRTAATPMIDAVAEMWFGDVGSIHADPPGPLPAVERATLLADLPDALVDTLLELVGPAVDSPVTVLEVRHLGGALARTPRVANATGNRSAGFGLFTGAIPAPGSDPAVAVRAVDEVLARVRPWSTGGATPNYQFADDAGPEQVRRMYDADAWERLREIKRDHDPRNMFRINLNIPPAG
jgi:FAD/FMN-containing dehydrogenase